MKVSEKAEASATRGLKILGCRTVRQEVPEFHVLALNSETKVPKNPRILFHCITVTPQKKNYPLSFIHLDYNSFIKDLYHGFLKNVLTAFVK